MSPTKITAAFCRFFPPGGHTDSHCASTRPKCKAVSSFLEVFLRFSSSFLLVFLDFCFLGDLGAFLVLLRIIKVVLVWLFFERFS